MLRLADTANYRKDYRRYAQAIEQIQDVNVQQRARQLLSQFKTQSSIIDEGHNPRNYGTIDPRTLRDNIKNLVETRRQLEQIVQDSR